jgi:hypothetical protein
MKQHKWHKEIKAWADGAEIEWTFRGLCQWHTDTRPDWADGRCDFRIKSQPKEPKYLYVYRMAGQHNVEFRFWDTKTDAPTYIGKIKLEVDDD